MNAPAAQHDAEYLRRLADLLESAGLSGMHAHARGIGAATRLRQIANRTLATAIYADDVTAIIDGSPCEDVPPGMVEGPMPRITVCHGLVADGGTGKKESGKTPPRRW